MSATLKRFKVELREKRKQTEHAPSVGDLGWQQLYEGDDEMRARQLFAEARDAGEMCRLRDRGVVIDANRSQVV